MNPLARFAVDRVITTSMVVLGVLVLGWISLTRLPLEFLPTFSSSSITVTAPYPSSSPQEVERLVVRPLEDALGAISGIDTLSAGATSEQAQIRISFIEGTDMDMAAVDVRDRVDQVRSQLPDDLERITIRRFQSTDIPVLRFDVSSDWDEARLYRFAEEVIQRRVERLEGVAAVTIGGLRVPEVRIELDRDRMQAHHVDVRELRSRLRSENLNLSAGRLDDAGRELLVRAIGEFSGVEEIAALPLGNGLRLADVADVSLGFPEQEDFNYLNGQESLTVAVNKASAANLLAVVDRAKAELAAIADSPEAAGLSYRIYRDASKDVRQGLAQLRNAGLLGGLLAILAVFVFLRQVRSTLLVAVAMPISVVATFVLLYLLRTSGLSDLTMNVISLAGLMLALGMLVDNSIVVIESIFRHRNELGEDARSAALRGTSEVAMPIIASTATTMCVFLPMIFLATGRRFKIYMENIGLTVCLVILASLVVALTVIPMVASRLLAKQSKRRRQGPGRLAVLYEKVLAFTLHHRASFVVVIAVLLVGSIKLFGTIEQSFSSRSLERQVVIRVDTPRQYSAEQTSNLYTEVYGILEENKADLDIADVAYAFDRGTGRSRGGWRRSRQIDVFLVDENEGELSTIEAREKIRELLPSHAGVELRIATSHSHGGGSSGIEIQLMGDDPGVLRLLADQVAQQLMSVEGVRDVDTSLESGDEEIRVSVNRDRAIQTGLSTQSVAFTISNSLSDRAVSRLVSADRELDIVMQFRAEDRETLDQLKSVSVHSGGTSLPLDAIADFDMVTGPTTLERENNRSQVQITANTTGSSGFMVMRTVSGMMSAQTLPPGYEWSFGRWNSRALEDQQSGLFALYFALPLVYMLLAALFESFIQPLTIMLSVPFALLGVAVSMKLADQPWDSMTMIGLIILLGVVVNNAIVLVDHINFLRASGMSCEEAILAGGRHRLRPILITAVTTILGLMPMILPFLLPQVFGPVEGRASTWAPMGLVIVGGLSTSTFLTLLIIPTVYSLLDDLSRFGRRIAVAARA